ncbi:DUF732 domain-containing protein [Microbacterium sp. A94]|uniref:DUF732 domain-containing protein n=1 Tax=Microbacterium sp. A94 TaxID=3450717 RepID=UPI003F4385DF
MSRFKYLAGVAVLSLLALTGCTTSSGVAQTGQTPRESEYEAVGPVANDDSGLSATEDDFIDFIKRNAPVGYAVSTDREVIAYGYGICKLLDDGLSVVEIMARTVELSTDDNAALAEMAQVSVAGAPQTLCPEHLESVQAQFEEFS